MSDDGRVHSHDEQELAKKMRRTGGACSILHLWRLLIPRHAHMYAPREDQILCRPLSGTVLDFVLSQRAPTFFALNQEACNFPLSRPLPA
jgi:hypothetical protein